MLFWPDHSSSSCRPTLPLVGRPVAIWAVSRLTVNNRCGCRGRLARTAGDYKKMQRAECPAQLRIKRAAGAPSRIWMPAVMRTVVGGRVSSADGGGVGMSAVAGSACRWLRSVPRPGGCFLTSRGTRGCISRSAGTPGRAVAPDSPRIATRLRAAAAGAFSVTGRRCWPRRCEPTTLCLPDNLDLIVWTGWPVSAEMPRSGDDVLSDIKRDRHWGIDGAVRVLLVGGDLDLGEVERHGLGQTVLAT